MSAVKRKRERMDKLEVGKRIKYRYWFGGSDMGGPYKPDQWSSTASGKIIRVTGDKVLVEKPGGERVFINQSDICEADPA